MHHRYEFQHHKFKCAEYLIFFIAIIVRSLIWASSLPHVGNLIESFLIFFFSFQYGDFFFFFVCLYLEGQKPFLPDLLSLLSPKSLQRQDWVQTAMLWSKQLLPLAPGAGFVFSFPGFLPVLNWALYLTAYGQCPDSENWAETLSWSWNTPWTVLNSCI